METFRKFCGEYQLLWRVKDFRRYFEEARSEGGKSVIFSPTFDTHRNGYKLQLSLCPNGDGRGWLSLQQLSPSSYLVMNTLIGSRLAVL